MATLSGLKSWAKRRLSPRSQAAVKRFGLPALAFFFRRDLNALATIWATDKWGCHWYTQHYQRHFAPYRRRRINLLEIGVGGYDTPELGGNSLYMWKSYFFRANIFSVDIFDKKALERRRIRIFQGSQIDADFLREVNTVAGGFDIIIDDGSHLNEQVIKSFEILFPLLRDGGWYVVEDLQTAYWPNCGGDSRDLSASGTSVNFFRNLVHGLNHKEFIKPDYVPTYFDRNITEIHFYHNMVFIRKGRNVEDSNIVVDNRRLKPTTLLP